MGVFLDFLWFYVFLIAVIFIYFYGFKSIAIYLTIAVIAILLLSYFPRLFKWMQWIKFRLIVDFLKPLQLVREEEILAQFPMKPDILHAKLFEMAKLWRNGPLLVFIKHYYLYLPKTTVDDAIQQLNELETNSEKKLGDVFKVLMQKYPFQTRLEVEALISKIRENEAFDFAKEKIKNPEFVGYFVGLKNPVNFLTPNIS